MNAQYMPDAGSTLSTPQEKRIQSSNLTHSLCPHAAWQQDKKKKYKADLITNNDTIIMTYLQIYDVSSLTMLF